MKYLIGIIVLFVFVFATDFLIHGLLLKEAYEATAGVWRPNAEMIRYMKFMLAGQFLFAVSIYFLFGRLKVESGHYVRTGLILGFWLGMMSVASNLIWYSVLPVPASMGIIWCVSVFIQSIVIGAGAGFLGSKRLGAQ